ncbi:MAG: hypothetical protein ABJN34_16920 [Litoreibacter sp.]|uniref:hypothetical protein n=1 Tax=Litoreibacter sp. TaxID=1969459 RepID=UPI003298A38C
MTLVVVGASVPIPVWQVAVAVFVLARIGQLWGRKVEGKPLLFLKVIQCLLIGSAWLLSFIYRCLWFPA